jgi:hypothetical protein
MYIRLATSFNIIIWEYSESYFTNMKTRELYWLNGFMGASSLSWTNNRMPKIAAFQRNIKTSLILRTFHKRTDLSASTKESMQVLCEQQMFFKSRLRHLPQSDQANSTSVAEHCVPASFVYCTSVVSAYIQSISFYESMAFVHNSVISINYHNLTRFRQVLGQCSATTSVQPSWIRLFIFKILHLPKKLDKQDF